jgi:hypothetical protein
MSIGIVTTNLLAKNPAVFREGDRAVARTNWWLQLLTLFSYRKQVIIDRRRKQIEIDTRAFWFFRWKTRIPFSRIERLSYGFAAFGTEWGAFWERTDQVESFTVGLVLRAPEETLDLFSFRGEGSVQTGWTGVLLGDSLVDFEGDQADASRSFVRILQEFTGASLTGPLPHIANQAGERFSCEQCKRPSPPNKKKCMYCGGGLVVVQE